MPDIIIVGAGSAGLFCALGLAGSASVTVIEAGLDPGDPPPAWLLHDSLFSSDLDWGYREADTGAELLRGRLTGGSSSVNSSAAVRGQPWDFDGWNVDGWRWQDCLPALLAIERDEQFGAAAYHGDTGPIPITRLDPGPIDDAFIAACRGAGHPGAEDHNRPRARSGSGRGRPTGSTAGDGGPTPG